MVFPTQYSSQSVFWLWFHSAFSFAISIKVSEAGCEGRRRQQPQHTRQTPLDLTDSSFCEPETTVQKLISFQLRIVTDNYSSMKRLELSISPNLVV